MAAKARKQITFDLNTKQMKIDGLNPSIIYNDIRTKLEKLNFTHTGGSVYMSDTTMTKLELEEKVGALVNRMPLLSYYINSFTVTNIGKQYELSTNIKQMSKDISKETLLKTRMNKQTNIDKEIDDYEI